MQNELRDQKREKRAIEESIRAKDDEVHVMQEKYEDMMSKLKLELKDEEAKQKRLMDGMQFEIDFLKKELKRQHTEKLSATFFSPKND